MIALDCTFRDGGYYNDWSFGIALANRYLKAMKSSKIDAIEIGFRSPPQKNGGVFINVTDEFIEKSLGPIDFEYFGVMVNTSEMNKYLIRDIFRHADDSPMNIVRAATHFKDTDLAEEVCGEFKELGYVVGCNLMQAADKSFDEISNTSKKIESWGTVDVLYLADSLGGMNHDVVNYAFKAINDGWSGPTGFHGHNNKGQALNNSLEAVDIGVDWIDGTVLGMGRGPGNTETEYLLGELNKRGFGEFELEEIYELVLNDFLPLKRQYEWGPSLPYYLAAEYNIHPIYIQRMMSGTYTMSVILNAIFYLMDKESNSFNKDLFEEVMIWTQ